MYRRNLPIGFKIWWDLIPRHLSKFESDWNTPYTDLVHDKRVIGYWNFTFKRSVKSTLLLTPSVYSFGNPADTLHCIHTVNAIPTVRCRYVYNAVNFLQNSHNRHPKARPLGRVMGLLWIQIWFMFCCYCNAVCNMMVYCTALQRHPTVLLGDMKINIKHRHR